MTAVVNNPAPTGDFFLRLYQAVDEQRLKAPIAPRDCLAELRAVLGRLAGAKHCNPRARWLIDKFENQKTRMLGTPCTQIRFTEKAELLGRHRALALSKLAGLEDGAKLTLLISM